MNITHKTLLLLAALLLPVMAGCWERKPEMAYISLAGNDHNMDVYVAGFTINDEMGSGIGGMSCCISIPRKWKPGMKIRVSWSYTKNSLNPNPPPPQMATVEIPEYDEKNLGHLDVHFFPGHRIKAVVTVYDIGSPFYPLPKEDWPPVEVNQNIIDSYREHPELDITPPTKIDREWAKQWGLIIEDKE